jgi:hypothetical protein
MGTRNLNPRTRTQLIRAAAEDLQDVIEARHPGHCTQCAHSYTRGTPIKRGLTGWDHATCTTSSEADNIHNRLRARRTALKTARQPVEPTRESATH